MTAPSSEENSHYALALGKLFGNLISLDAALRAALDVAYPSLPGPLHNGRPLTTLNVGDQAAENWITKRCYLSDLVTAYNELQGERGRPERKIDAAVVDLRNALAHGFVTAAVPGGILTLMKFGRGSAPRSLEVTEKVELTPEWMADQLARVRDVFFSVVESSGWR
jgi:hypothetical protein